MSRSNTGYDVFTSDFARFSGASNIKREPEQLPVYNPGMSRPLTIQLPDDSRAVLEELGRRRSRSAEDVAQDILRRVLVVAQLRQMREQLRPKAEAAGFRSEDDILDAIS